MVYRLYIRMLAKKVDFMIVTSLFGRKIFSNAFDLPSDKCVVLGQPCHDALYNDENNARELLEKILDRRNLSNYKIVFYIPTYRAMEYYKVSTREVILSLLSSNEFKSFLKEFNILLVVKYHPFDEFFNINCGNVAFVDNEKLRRLNLTIYDFLGCADVLITDYSSIFYDFLLLNKPIVLYIPDIELYRRYPGLMVDLYKMPCEKATNISELISSLKKALECPYIYYKERVKLRNIFFSYNDGNSTKRCALFIIRLYNKHLLRKRDHGNDQK